MVNKRFYNKCSGAIRYVEKVLHGQLSKSGTIVVLDNGARYDLEMFKSSYELSEKGKAQKGDLS